MSASLAQDARSELAAIAPSRRCDRLAEVSALFHTAGTAHLLGRGRLAFHLDVAENAVARRTFALLRGLRVDSEIRTYSRPAFDRSTRFQLHLEGDEHALDVLAEAGVLDRDRRPLERPPGHVVARTCCRSAYLRGSFLGGGSLSGPRSPHLELRFPRHPGATFLRAVASTEDVRLRVLDRTSHSIAYAKSWDAVEGYLAASGAVETALALEERAVVAGVQAQANRLANADHANLVRQSEAAQAQLEAIRTLAADGRLAELSEQLRLAAELRSHHPMLSLRELAARADPPVTKAAMQRRLARLVDLAGQ